MRPRSLISLPIAALITFAVAGVAAAGGWATATLDPPPDNPVAGEPVEMGFTLMQHGMTPMDWGVATFVVIDGESGERTDYRATLSDPPGHWTVEVSFPDNGTYRFEVLHDVAIQSVNVAETTLAVGASGISSTSAATPSVGLAALAGALGLILAVGLWFVGGLRTPSPARVARTAPVAPTPEHA